MKLDQVIEYSKINNFLQNHAENEKWKLVPNLSFFKKKALYEVKAMFRQLSVNQAVM